jgi:hypothetical protein
MGRPRRYVKRVSAVAAVVAVLTCVGLFVHAYQQAGPSHGDAAGPGASDSATPSPSASPAAAPAAARPNAFDPNALSLPPYTITPPPAPGFAFATPAEHRIVLAASSRHAIGRVGYLAPTSPDHPSGDVKHVGRQWVVHTTVTGSPYYALVFVQAGADGTPITCSITLDGKVLSRKSTSGAYGRQVCVG